MASHFVNLMTAVHDESDRPLRTLDLLSETERHRVLVEWNDSKVAHPTAGCVHRAFEDRARECGGAIAVVDNGTHITFAELNRRANRLSHHLTGLGIGSGAQRVRPDLLVGLLLEPSVELVIALLAVVKSGAAYVPLDARLPPDRLRAIANEAGLAAVLTAGPLPELFDDLVSACAVDLVGDAALIAANPCDDPTTAVAVDSPAYVLFTSGSTGRPKGVVVHHRALTNHMQWMERAFPLTAADRVLQRTPFSFDASVWEFWAPLMAGATLAMVPRGAHREPGSLARVLDEHRVTVMQVVPTLLELLIDEPAACQYLKTMFCGGEPLPVELARRYLASGWGARLINLYGPTETTIDASFHTVEALPAGGTVPIGRPIDNVTLYVLDADQRLAPPGARGELYIGGAGVGQGYLRQPGLTAERYLPDPYSHKAGSRMYRTGDLVRRLADGNIEFLGRIDAQVKVRGFRIELGEIEAVLQTHPGVHGAVASAREDRPGDKRLVAYVVVAEEQPTAAELRAHMKTKLPLYMVPATFVTVEAFPLLPSGKVDRRSLPAPGITQRSTAVAYVAPRTAEEEPLCEIWRECLGLERVGVHDDFFELGGHSLLATQVISRIRKGFGAEVPLRSIFENPTVAELAEEIQRTGHAEVRADADIEPRARTGDLPLSFAQQRLWFLDQLEPGTTLYNAPEAFRLRGPLDPGALEAALCEIVRRHEALRATFPSRGGVPYASIAAEPDFVLHRTDVSGDGDPDGDVLRCIQRKIATPFELDRGPLLRAALLRCGADDHVLLLNLHHIVTDGWSQRVLYSELRALYEDFVAGQPSRLSDPTVQYADFAAWQREWLRGDTLQRQLDYWRCQLRDLPMLELPTDRPRPKVQSHRGGGHSFELSAQLTRRLRAVAVQHRSTPFMIALAAFYLLLHRYSGQDDFAIGIPIANRNRREIEDLIGFFVNMLVIRVDLGGDTTFAELLARVRETTLDAYTHQDLPFEKLVDELETVRDTSRSPLFQVSYTLDDELAYGSRSDRLELMDIDSEPFDLELRRCLFDLELVVWAEDESLRGQFMYAAELFEATTIAAMADSFETLLEAVIEAPERPLREIDLLSPTERRTLLVEWNDTRRDEPRADLVHELFEARVEEDPEARALEGNGEQLSYAQLERRANRLAHHLLECGVGTETRVGLLLERSPNMVVAVLAVLKAGGAYVPLDPTYPEARVRFMLQDAAAALLVSEAHLTDRVPGELSCPVILLDAAATQIEACPAEPPDVETHPEQLAYVIYTSGSTGTPKGVGVPHRSLSNHTRSARRAYQIEPGDRVLQFASLSFDISVEEIFPTLMAGATLVLRDEELAAGLFLRQLRERRITVLILSTGYWHELVDELERSGEPLPAALRLATVGGEAMRPDRVRAWTKIAARGAPSARLVNGYGPTEATVVATRWTAPEEIADGNGAATVPIGRPIDNVSVYVLDDAMRVCPVGAVGELYIGGLGVARGYLNRPGLTAASFVPDPFGPSSGDRGGRLYKTGDRVRYRPDGELEFLGRIDNQVKIRGFRIELGEIEAGLRDQPGVTEATVVARLDHPGGRLAAYVVATPGETPSRQELRRFARTRLPDYMVPSTFTVLTELPLTPAGKVDRAALPQPDQGAPEETPAVPRTATEELLAGIWCRCLRVDQVGIHDNFFELGGHSLLATQVISRIRSLFGVELPILTLFDRPTVAQLAKRLDDGDDALRAAESDLIARRSDASETPLSFFQERLWALDRLTPGSSIYHVREAMRLSGPLDIGALWRAFGAIVRRHDALRTIFPCHDGTVYQAVAEPGEIEPRVVDLSGLPTGEREAAASRHLREAAEVPFDLARGPLLRATLLRCGPEEHILLLVFHHLVTDAWSATILLRELETFYTGLTNGGSPAVGELPLQYPDFADWQRRRFRGQVLEEQLSYWGRQLTGLPELRLPYEEPSSTVRSYHGAELPFRVSREATRKVEELGREYGCTAFMSVAAALAVVLHGYSRQVDFGIGFPIANRNIRELEQMIGNFVNFLVLRVDLRGNPRFADLLARVRQTTLEAYAHQDLPFQTLLEHDVGVGSASGNPLFQAYINMQTAATPGLALPGLSVDTMAVPGPAERFELGPPRWADARARPIRLYLALDQILEGVLVYNRNLFSMPTISRMLNRFETTLVGAAVHPELRVLDLWDLAVRKTDREED